MSAFVSDPFTKRYYVYRFTPQADPTVEQAIQYLSEKGPWTSDRDDVHLFNCELAAKTICQAHEKSTTIHKYAVGRLDLVIDPFYLSSNGQ